MNPSQPHVHEPTGPTRSRWVRPAVVAVVSAVVLGIGSGLIWLWLADPARWEVREGGIVLTEAASRGQFQVVVVFVLVGVVVSLLAGGGAARLLPDAGWAATALVVVLTSVAALIAWRVGVELGPPSPRLASDVAVGDTVPAQLAVDAVAPFVVWPVFGLAGLIAGTWAGDRRVSERSGPPRLE